MIILAIVYVIISIGLQLMRFVYNFNLYQNISNLKEQAQTEHMTIRDGMPIWRKIIVVLLAILAIFLQTGVNAISKYTGSLFPNSDTQDLNYKEKTDLSAGNNMLDSTIQELRQKSRDAKRISDVLQIQTALELYYLQNDTYPQVDYKVDLGSHLCLDELNGFIDREECNNPIMTLVPDDPSENQSGYTYQSQDGTTYFIEFFLEVGTDDFSSGEHFITPKGIDLEDTQDEPTEVKVTSEQDSDGDGLSDNEEDIWDTDYLNPDNDNDGLSDYLEVNEYNTDPLDPDTDDDSYLDGEEVGSGYNPLGEGKL